MGLDSHPLLLAVCLNSHPVSLGPSTLVCWGVGGLCLCHMVVWSLHRTSTVEVAAMCLRTILTAGCQKRGAAE